MSFQFTVKEFILGSGTGTPPLQFFKRGFNLGGSGSQPSWRDVILSGNTALTLVNAKADSLNYVKLFGGTEQRNLPSGYTQVEYIANTGSGYIDTGIVLKTFDLDVECDLQFTDISGTTPSMAWGYMGSASNLPRWGFGFYNTGWLGSANATSAVGTKDTDRHTVVLSTKLNAQNEAIYEATVDSTSYYGTAITSPSTFEGNTLSVYLFARNNNGTAGNNASCKIYGFKVKKAGVITHNLVPCKNSSNTLGMYDLVTNTFMPATGTLTAGSDVVPTPTLTTPVDIVSNNGALKVRHKSGLPLDYTLLEYIQGTGTQWLDTGIVPTLNAKAEVVFSPVSQTQTGYWGARRDPIRFGCVTFSSGSQFGIGMTYNSWPSNRTTTSYSTIYDCIVANGYVSINGTEYTETAITQYTTPAPFRLCAFDAGGSVANVSKAKFYKCKLWESNVLVFDGIPAQDSNGLVGMYDLVSRQFFTNASTTYPDDNFVAGGIVNDIEIYADGTVETVNVHGKNLLDDNTKRVVSTTQWRYMDTAATGGGFVLKKGVTYTLSATTSVYVYFYDYNTATAITSAKQTCTYTPTEDTRASFLIYLSAGVPNDTLAQLEVGSTATAYEPYYNGGTATAEMLLKVSNYADVQEILTGAVTRNIGILVLDGTEDWTMTAQQQRSFYNTMDTINANTENELMCSHFKVGDRNTAVVGNVCVRLNRNGLLFTPSGFSTLAGWTSYLAQQYNAGTPVVVIYPLQTPTTETVTGQPLTIQAGTNVVEITQASIDNLGLEVSYKAGVEVTVTEIENAQLDNSVEVTVNG